MRSTFRGVRGDGLQRPMAALGSDEPEDDAGVLAEPEPLQSSSGVHVQVWGSVAVVSEAPLTAANGINRSTCLQNQD